MLYLFFCFDDCACFSQLIVNCCRYCQIIFYGRKRHICIFAPGKTLRVITFVLHGVFVNDFVCFPRLNIFIIVKWYFCGRQEAHFVDNFVSFSWFFVFIIVKWEAYLHICPVAELSSKWISGTGAHQLTHGEPGAGTWNTLICFLAAKHLLLLNVIFRCASIS